MSSDPNRNGVPPEGGGLTPLKRAFLALEDAQARLAAAESAAREPVAVIGTGCRVPGADGPDEFWALLRDGRDAIGPIPPDRFDADAYYNPDPAVPGTINTRSGGFLRDVAGFDAGLFQIAPREAQGMDPQQRLLLEVAWEALENAGQAPDALEGSATGVYVGVTSSDYAYLQLKAGDPSLFDAHYTSGIAHSVVSGRLSYLLGLQGPSVAIDTACSSSLVAVHHACLALRARDCRMAIAGGVNVILSPDLFVALSHSRMLAPDGRCKAFAASADGFARAEGCGLVVLKRLSDAVADGDRILALIRGSAVNQDGPSSSLTAPNGPAQEAVVRQALERAGIGPGDVSYIEAHGTGTQLGDPLEAQALGSVFGPGRDPARPLWLGSVKTNVGHLEGAAGVAGLLKLVLSLRARQIPPHLHFAAPSPHIPWTELPLRVPTALTAWEPIGGRRIGGVSAFGFSGTNVHVVVEEAPAPPPAVPSPAGRAATLFVCSARDGQALVQLAGRLADAVAGQGDATLADLAHTSAVGRAHLPHRATVLARSRDELRERLAAVADGRDAEGVRAAAVSRRDPPRIAFLFTGQGAQYAGMARGIYAAAPAFRAALDECAELMAPHLPRPLFDVIWPGEGQSSPIDETAFTQPALFAVEVALARLWRSWGIVPAAVMGHSIGELAAAHVAGVLGLEEACRLVAARGRLMQSLPAGGAMAAIFAPEAQVAEALAPHRDVVAIAAVNAPGQTVVSGRAAEVQAVSRTFAERGVRVQPLTVSHAFHSPLVDPILDAFEREAAAVRFSPPRLRVVSNLTGRLADAGQIEEPSYWRRHVREAVRFGDGLAALAALKPDVLLEVGPHPTLLSFAKTAFGEAAPLLVPSLRKGRADWEQMLDAVASLHLHGAAVSWRAVEEGSPGRTVDLPTYPFQRERFWFQAGPAAAGPPRGRDTGHPLLGTKLRVSGEESVYERRTTPDTPGFLRHHRVRGRIVMPAAAYLETLVAAAQDLTGQESVTVEDVVIGRAMLFGEEEARTVQLVCGKARDGVSMASIASLAEDASDGEPWSRHVTARLRAGATAEDGAALDGARARCTAPVDPAELTTILSERDVELGAPFRVVKSCQLGGDESLGRLELPADAEAEADSYLVHPMLIDGCLQLLAPLLVRDGEDLFLPVGVARLALHRRAGIRCECHAVVRPSGRASKLADVRAYDEEGRLVAELTGLRLQRVARDVLEGAADRWLADNAYEPTWRTAELPASSPSTPGGRHVVIVADRGPLAERLAGALQGAGHRVTVLAERNVPDMRAARVAGAPVDAVVYASALDETPWLESSVQTVSMAESAGPASVLEVVRALVAETPPPQLWILTRGAQQATDGEAVGNPLQAQVWGLARTLRLEHPELRCVSIDLDAGGGATEAEQVAREMHAGGAEPEVALRVGSRRVSRLVRLRPLRRAGAPAAPYRLAVATRGALEGLKLERFERRAPGPGEVEIEVEATGLNFRDVLNLLGMYPGDPGPLGGECAGRVSAVGPGVSGFETGDEVLAVQGGSFASHVVAKAYLVARRPEGVGAEEGASFPIAFMTAEFCLGHVAGLRAGERVLVHAAAGGVGMAAVRLAQRKGAIVFATAGAPWKRELLRDLGVEHVFDSRKTAFADEILSLTGGVGVDVVLNSLSGDAIEASFRALARGGRFVEMGKRGIKDPTWVAGLGRDVAYTIVDWGETATKEPALVGGLLARLVEELRTGALAPLPRHTFPLSEATRAFRFMAQARHAGKIVVSHGDPSPPSFRRDGTYLVTGGTGGLGVAVGHWLAERGAGRIVLVGRRGPTPGVAAAAEAMRARGAQVLVEAVDVADDEKLGALLRRLRASGPPLRGVVHGAAVLDDAVVLGLDESRFAKVLAPKVRGGWLLDRGTRADPLDWFVLFSSVAGLFGSRGQANYASANAFLDALARERTTRGLPATSIDWGAWGEVGVAADRDLLARLAVRGLGTITPARGLAALERLIASGPAQAAVFPVDWPKFLGEGPTSPFLAETATTPAAGPGSSAGEPRVAAGPVSNLRAQLETVPPGRRRRTVEDFVKERAARALGLDPGRAVDPRRPLGEMGLDSLLAVELRNTLGTALGHTFSATLLFDHPTIESLTDHILESVLGATGAGAPVEKAESADLATSIGELSDEEVERQLAARAARKGHR